MGSSESKVNSNFKIASKSDFRFNKIIGTGGFGKVWHVETRKGSRTFALKEMQKSLIIARNGVSSILNERLLLSLLKHPFIVSMQYAFQDRLRLYLVMELMPGGDLRTYLSKRRIISEPEAKFMIVCILIGLEYLHINGIIHRDIKPENLVFDSKGYLRITDFGIARFLSKNNSNDSTGTPGYMSPEVMMKKNHGIEADYFSLGIIAFECMMRRRPYLGKSRNEIKDQILVQQIQLKKSNVPEDWTPEAVDFINKLIQRNPKDRLGFNGTQEVKNHEWLADVEWRKMLEKTIESPCQPKFEDNFSQKTLNNFKAEEDSDINIDSMQHFFIGYQFDSSSKCQDCESACYIKK